MNKLVLLLMALALVFVISYDPQISGDRGPNKLLPVEARTVKPVAAGCEADRYYELQFAEDAPGAPCRGRPVEFAGAII